ncbi:DUF4238 domain-containing protein [Hujiaoplasma nucleasis]|uniref:DUF4238 domain-containing protein n=1 Tax=Hujiaoplasma nucleasis TaxID=2725268 RepID=A0A7L6N855_9MOLU|nr:DUF4238 domain-containing protein [Hujiaoplasma nucleasis]QLY40724.1 DUF4238 domain-containing protein [Hujiaoplasma nucleasis]
MSEPIKHHFIPQFILRNFLDENQINYWNMKTGKFERRNPKSIFMRKNLYKDVENHPDEIMTIEKKFASLEREVSELINNKILDKKEIRITRADNELLRRFLFLLGFRSENRKRQYRDELFDQFTIETLKPFVKNNNYVDLWLRELNEMLDLASFGELQNNKEISTVIKMDLQSELRDYYMSFVEARGQEFILSDIYPTTEIFPIDISTKTKIDLHAFFPISPNRVLILNYVIFRKDRKVDEPMINAMRNFSRVGPTIIEIPRVKYVKRGTFSQEDEYTYTVRKIYEDEVSYINSLYLNEAKDGFIFNDFSKVLKSIQNYNNVEQYKRKNAFEGVEDIINNS